MNVLDKPGLTGCRVLNQDGETCSECKWDYSQIKNDNSWCVKQGDYKNVTNIAGAMIEPNGNLKTIGGEFMITNETRGSQFNSTVIELKGMDKFVVVWRGSYVNSACTIDFSNRLDLTSTCSSGEYEDNDTGHLAEGHVGLAGLVYDFSNKDEAPKLHTNEQFIINQNSFGGDMILKDLKAISSNKFVALWIYYMPDPKSAEFDGVETIKYYSDGSYYYVNPYDPSLRIRIFTVNDDGSIIKGPETRTSGQV